MYQVLFLVGLSREVSLIEERTFYVFINMFVEIYHFIIFLDRFGVDWRLMLDYKVRGFTYLGVLITRSSFIEANTSSFSFKYPMGIPRSYPSTLPLVMSRSSPRIHCVSFVDEIFTLGMISIPRLDTHI